MAMAMVINSLHAGNLRHMGIHCADQRLDQVVLLRTCRIFADYYDHDNDHQNIKCFEMSRPMLLLFNPNKFTIITSALVHINEPSLVESTNGLSVRLCHSLVHSTQQDALNLFGFGFASFNYCLLHDINCYKITRQIRCT